MGEQQILIQNRRTGQFLRNAGLWVEVAEEAKRFKSALQAYDFAVTNKVPEAEIVVETNHRVESILQKFSSRTKNLPGGSEELGSVSSSRLWS